MKDKLLAIPVLRYLLAGGAAYGIELAVLLGLHRGAGLAAELATAIAFWVGLVTAFWLQKVFAFKDYKKTRRAISKQLSAYGLLVAFNYVFTLMVVTVFPEDWLIFSRTLALGITTVWNYLLYKIIFHDNPGQALRDVGAAVKSWLTANRRKLLFIVVASLPVLAYFYQYLFTGNRIVTGDFDYYAQMYEAARTTVLQYHQFPDWNPWLSGGVPLYANPQFGLFSPQFLLVLPFGAVYGMKLAYVLYALAGFWGMYALCRRVFSSSVLRSVLVSYIWVFCAFFAIRGIGHFTFPSYYLLPLLVYFLARRHEGRNWLWLGLIFSWVALSSLHYAFLMFSLALVAYAVLMLLGRAVETGAIKRWQILLKADILFALKTFAVIGVVAGHRIVMTYLFVSHNEKSAAMLAEPSMGPRTLFQQFFSPTDWLTTAPPTPWGWGEYTMYIGLGSAAACAIIGLVLLNRWRRRQFAIPVHNPVVVAALVIFGLMALSLAAGSFHEYSPFTLIHHLPGFGQTRVSGRWSIFMVFAILSFFAAWRRTPKLLNLVLAISVVELFVLYGPINRSGQHMYSYNRPTFSDTFTTYDNGKQHLDMDQNIFHSYLYTTQANIGQIYADDSLVDTLHETIGTVRCGQNINPACDLVLSDNANVTYWSPNKIIFERTAPGPIELNMNVHAGWRVNDVYPYAAQKRVDPRVPFILSADEQTYTLEYSPKLSYTWMWWKLRSAF